MASVENYFISQEADELNLRNLLMKRMVLVYKLQRCYHHVGMCLVLLI